MAPHLEASPPASVPRAPRQTILSQVVAEPLDTFLAPLAADPTATGLPADVVDALSASLPGGLLAHGCVRLGGAWRSRPPLSASRCSPGSRHGPCIDTIIVYRYCVVKILVNQNYRQNI
jgi:hypothetical protein